MKYWLPYETVQVRGCGAARIQKEVMTTASLPGFRSSGVTMLTRGVRRFVEGDTMTLGVRRPLALPAGKVGPVSLINVPIHWAEGRHAR